MKLYVVRNKNGQFFRAKGYNSYGLSWVDMLERARLYTKIGPAKATITYFAKTGPEHGIPNLLEFDLEVSAATVIDMTAVTTKAVERINRKKLKREERYANYEIQRLQDQQAEISRRLSSLTVKKSK